MKIRILGLMTAILAVSGLFFTGCKDDDAPKTTKVYGTITLDNAELWETWQDSGVLEVTIFPAFSLDPLAGWGAVPDGTFGPGIPGGTFAVGAPFNSQDPVVLEYKAGQTKYDYEIEVEPGTYSALAVGFRHDGVTNPSLKTATLGAFYGNEDVVSHGIVIRPAIGAPNIFEYPAPSAITIKAEEQQELNFKADFGFVEVWYQ